MKPTKTQREVMNLMRAGHALFWFGSSGPEIACRSFWPQPRTVRAMVGAGLLRWGEYLNATQRAAGIRPLLLVEVVE